MWLHWEELLEACAWFLWTMIHVPLPLCDLVFCLFTVINLSCEYNYVLSPWVLLANYWNWGWSWDPKRRKPQHSAPGAGHTWGFVRGEDEQNGCGEWQRCPPDISILFGQYQSLQQLMDSTDTLKLATRVSWLIIKVIMKILVERSCFHSLALQRLHIRELPNHWDFSIQVTEAYFSYFQ